MIWNDRSQSEDLIKTIAGAVAFWVFLVGLVILGLGTIPSSPLGWGLLIAFGPIGYLLASALGEAGMARLSRLARRLKLGSLGRIALLLLVLVPFTALLLLGRLACLTSG